MLQPMNPKHCHTRGTPSCEASMCLMKALFFRSKDKFTGRVMVSYECLGGKVRRVADPTEGTAQPAGLIQPET